MHAIMAQEIPDVSVSSSSSAPASCTWWDHILHANSNPFSSSSSSSAWSTTMTHRWAPAPPPPPSNQHYRFDALSSSYDDGTATSLTNDSSSADLSGEPVVDQNHHLWNQVLLNVENGGDQGQQNSQVVDDGENFRQVLSSKRDKIEDSNWPEPLHPSSSSLKYLLEKHLSNHSNGRAANYNLSDLVSNWSLAPPSSTPHHHLAPSARDDNAYICHPTTKYEANLPVQLSSSSTSCEPISNYSASFGMRRESQIIPWFDQRNNYLQHQMPLELQSSKPSSHGKGSDLLFDGNNKQQGCESSSPMKGTNGRSASGTTEGLKKKRSEESSEMHLKKKKYESSTVSSNNKLQVPKVKTAEKISALQQLVSPFGKTDQASVLMETINCIKVLQEQVQLLSDPYLKSGVSKEHNPWGGELEMRKEKAGASYDLRSSGLCLVPVSSIPQVHRESCRPDYWMPTYRTCFYR